MLKHKLTLLTTALLMAMSCAVRAQQKAKADTPQPAAGKTLGLNAYNLKEFGPVKTRLEAETTYKKALKEMTAKNGGILVIPEDVPRDALLQNTARWSHSVKPESAELRDWKVGPGVTVIDNRQGSLTLRVPQVGQRNNAGLTLARTLQLPYGDSLQHWTEESVLNISNNVIHGACNYMDWILEPVKAGSVARFYVPQVRNLFVGGYLNAHQGPGYGGKCARITIKDIGYDKEKRCYYFTASTPFDHKAGAIVQNKSHVNAIRVNTSMNSSSQTWDCFFKRKMYGNGDSEILHLTFDYMSNIHSMAGDENGNCLVAHIHGLTDIFRAEVQSMNDQTHQLVFTKQQNPQTLGQSRPIINLNKDKWVTKGKVLIVPAESYWDLVDTGKYPYKGKTYPTTLYKVKGSGVTGLHMGGLIRGDKDCPWDKSLIGRFFAVDEASECVEGRKVKTVIRRWYEINDIIVNSDGTKDLVIKRFWWGAKDAGSPTLYDDNNYTYDGHVKPLSYVIAPGAYVYNLSEAVIANRTYPNPKRTLYMTPGPTTGTKLGFAKGDPIEQAIGPDPFQPQALRAWAFDKVPGAWPAAMFDIANHGRIQRNTVFAVQGGTATLEGCVKRKDKKTPWKNVLALRSASEVGILCDADFANAAILFKQPNREQPMKWCYGEREKGKPVAEAIMQVSNKTGQFEFNSPAGIKTRGISGDETPARNLCGKNIQVKSGSRKVEITFAVPEYDANYAVFIEQSWLGSRAITQKTEKGFTIEFDKPCAEGAMIDWMLVR